MRVGPHNIIGQEMTDTLRKKTGVLANFIEHSRHFFQKHRPETLAFFSFV
jgi:hypothetical protein